ncbi:MAG: serine/threonine-protein kinase [Planctomycetota bacterium]|nr:serine/threonine-protein kinase [Planctomycetota bacterium]
MNEPRRDEPRSVPPPEIPGYRIEGVLGRGASGVVYRAVQASVGRAVALKIMHPQAVGSRRAVRRLQREARTAALLSHPNIVSAIDMGRTQNTWWFAMELVEGQSLSERLERAGRMGEREALRVFIPLCDALQHASEQGVVHRDVKPANILLTPEGKPRLVDLGLARVDEDPLLTRTGATLGTPHYISPEQARNPSAADVQSDLWSVGATLFHAVCGRPPFTGESAAELLSDVLYAPVPDARDLRPELSRGLALVLRKCLSRDRQRRYFTPAELTADLERVRARRAPDIRPGSLEASDAGGRVRRPRVLLAAGAALILAGLLGFWRPWARTPDPPLGGGDPDEHAARVARVEAELASDGAVLARVYTGVEAALARAVTGAQREAAGRLERAFDRELTVAVFEAQRALEALVAPRLAEGDFTEAEALLEERAARLLFEHTGFALLELPKQRHRRAFTSTVERLGEAVAGGRSTRRAALLTGLAAHVRDGVRPEVERHLAAGAWAQAWAAAAREPLDLCGPARLAPPQEVDAELVAALAPVRRELERLVDRLRDEWVRHDRELRELVEGLAGRARADLEAGGGVAVLAAFEEAFGEARRVHGLDWSGPDGHRERFTRAAEEAFERRRGELADLERELALRAAVGRLGVLEERGDAALAMRRYSEAAELWSARAGEPALAGVGRTIDLRQAEALALEAFLACAADGVRRAAGAPKEIVHHRIRRSGRLTCGADPLRSGFRLAGHGTDFLLVGERDGAALIDARTLESFVDGRACGLEEARVELARALFRYREGDLDGARSLLESEALPAGEPLVAHLAGLLSGAREELEQRLVARALAASAAARRELAAVHSDPQRLQRVEALLREDGDVLSDAQKDDLRELAAALDTDARPPDLDAFRERFGPSEARFVGPDRVWMRYRFDAVRAGAWERGDWHFDTQGWIPTRIASDLAELVETPCPRLLLVPLLEVDRHPLEVTISFDQPAGRPPDLLAISVLGFHVAFTHRGGGEPACLVDTGELSAVLERVRAGAGVPFPGFAAGTRHEVTLRVTREGGRVRVDVDGVEVRGGLRRVPGEARGKSLSIRALEPVRLVAVTLEGGR